MVVATALAAVAGGVGLAVLSGGGASAAGGPSITPDASFNGGSPVLLTFPTPSGASGTGHMFATAVARQSDGKVVVGGVYGFSGRSDFDVARLNSDGSLDASFGSGGYAAVSPISGGSNSLNGVAIQSDGKIVLAGSAASNGQPSQIALARLTSTGAIDTTFGSSGVVLDTSGGGASALALDSSGNILTAGFGGTVRRYTPAGAIDTSFGSGGTSASLMQNARALGTQSDGKIVIAGSTFISSNGHAIVARLNSDGSTDTSFGTNAGSTDLTSSGSESLSSLAFESSDIVVGGAESSGSTSQNLIARLDSTGHLDSSFGSGGKSIDGGGQDVNSLLYVPYPSIQVVTQGTSTNTAGVGAADPNTGAVLSGTSTPLPGGGGLDASAETCDASAGVCTTDSVGQNPDASHALVTQDKASDTSSGTTSQTTTTTTRTTTTDRFNLSANIKGITHGAAINWVDWNTRVHNNFGGKPRFDTGGWFEGTAKVTVSNVSQQTPSPPFPSPAPGHALSITPDQRLHAEAKIELTHLDGVNDSAVTGGPKCVPFAEGRKSNGFSAPDELVCTIRNLNPLEETGPLNVSFATSDGIGTFHVDARDGDCLKNNDEGNSDGAYLAGCDNNLADEYYNFNPPTELHEPEIGAAGMFVTWLIASFTGSAPDATAATTGGIASSKTSVDVAVLGLTGPSSHPACNWLSDQSGRFGRRTPKRHVLTVRAKGTLCDAPVWIKAKLGPRPSGVHVKAPARATFAIFRLRHVLPRAGYVVLMRVVSRVGSSSTLETGQPKALGISAAECVSNGLCK